MRRLALKRVTTTLISFSLFTLTGIGISPLQANEGGQVESVHSTPLTQADAYNQTSFPTHQGDYSEKPYKFEKLTSNWTIKATPLIDLSKKSIGACLVARVEF